MLVINLRGLNQCCWVGAGAAEGRAPTVGSSGSGGAGGAESCSAESWAGCVAEQTLRGVLGQLEPLTVIFSLFCFLPEKYLLSDADFCAQR